MLAGNSLKMSFGAGFEINSTLVVTLIIPFVKKIIIIFLKCLLQVKNDLEMEIVEYFITKGADSYAKNGQTLVADDFCPLQMAIGKKHALKKYDQFAPPD